MEPVKRLLFEMWRRERDAWLNFPPRYNAEIASRLGIDQNEPTIELERCFNEFLNERADQSRINIGNSE